MPASGRHYRPRTAWMLFNWIAGVVAIAFFGFSSGQLVGYTVELFQRWI